MHCSCALLSTPLETQQTKSPVPHGGLLGWLIGTLVRLWHPERTHCLWWTITGDGCCLLITQPFASKCAWLGLNSNQMNVDTVSVTHEHFWTSFTVNWWSWRWTGSFVVVAFQRRFPTPHSPCPNQTHTLRSFFICQVQYPEVCIMEEGAHQATYVYGSPWRRKPERAKRREGQETAGRGVCFFVCFLIGSKSVHFWDDQWCQAIL